MESNEVCDFFSFRNNVFIYGFFVLSVQQWMEEHMYWSG